MEEIRALARRLVIFSELAISVQLRLSKDDLVPAVVGIGGSSSIVAAMILSSGVGLAVPVSVGFVRSVTKLRLRRFIRKIPFAGLVLQELTERTLSISSKVEWEYFSCYYLRLPRVEVMGVAICYDLLEDSKQAMLKCWAADNKNCDVVKKIEHFLKKFENDKLNPFLPQEDFEEKMKKIVDDHTLNELEYEDMIDVMIPDDENWEMFCDEYLQLPYCVISFCKLNYDGKYFKLSTLKIWESWNETVNECEVEDEEFSDTEQSLSKRVYRLAKRFISERAIEQKFIPLISDLIPEMKDWKIFSTHYLNLEPGDVDKILKLNLDEIKKKLQILRLCKIKNSGIDENEHFKLAKTFIEQSAAFQFVAKLITYDKDWKSFARYQLKLAKSDYKDYINGRELTVDVKVEMLWDWRRKNKDKNLCEMLETHFSNNSTLLAAIRAIPSQITSNVSDFAHGIASEVQKSIKQMTGDMRQVNVTVNGDVKAENFYGYKVTNNYSEGSKV